MRQPADWQIYAITFIRMVYNTVHRMVYPFLTIFARGLGVSLDTMAFALAARSAVGTIGPFAASLADRHGRRLGMLLGAALFTIGAGLVVLWPTFPMFLAALVFCALGKYIFDPSLEAFLGDRVPYERRGRAIAITEFGWALAFILGIPLAGFLIRINGWMAPFPLMAILGVLIFAGLWRMLPRDEIQTSANTSKENFKLVLTSIPALAGLALSFFSSGANEQVSVIFGVWLEDSFSLQIAALGMASAVIGISELGAEGLVVAFVDRLGKPRAIILGLALNSAAAISLPFIGGTQIGALLGLFFFYLTFEFTLVSVIPMMTEVLPAARATLMAFNVAAQALGRALGAFVAPWLYHLGFLAVAGSAIVFNLVALFAVRQLMKRWQ